MDKVQEAPTSTAEAPTPVISDKDWSSLVTITRAVADGVAKSILPALTVVPDSLSSLVSGGQKRDPEALKVPSNPAADKISDALDWEQRGGCTGAGGLTGEKRPQRDPDALKGTVNPRFDSIFSGGLLQQKRDLDALKPPSNPRADKIQDALDWEQNGGCTGAGGLTGQRRPQRDPDALRGTINPRLNSILDGSRENQSRTPSASERVPQSKEILDAMERLRRILTP